MSNINHEYKDRLFKFIFGNPENKEWTLSLYNAINGSHYTVADEIKFNTLENVLYMGMKNDVSFLIDNTVNFYEQQSTFNPNMPMRMFIYAGSVYSNYIDDDDNGYNQYSSKLQTAPAPKFICFYNGTKDTNDKVILKLSDAFNGKADMELTVTMININYNHNESLLTACKPLKEYSWFVDKIRTNQKSMKSLESSVDKALDEMPEDWLLKPFLMKNKAEVKKMCLTEYNEEKTLAKLRKEYAEEGREEGKIEGKIEVVLNMLADESMSHDMIAKFTNLPLEKIEEIAASAAAKV